jgi:hypothetical protein
MFDPLNPEPTEAELLAFMHEDERAHVRSGLANKQFWEGIKAQWRARQNPVTQEKPGASEQGEPRLFTGTRVPDQRSDRVYRERERERERELDKANEEKAVPVLEEFPLSPGEAFIAERLSQVPSPLRPELDQVSILLEANRARMESQPPLSKSPPRLSLSRIAAGGLFALFFGSLIQALTLLGVITMNSGHVFMLVAFAAGALLLTTEILPVKPRRHKVVSVIMLGLVLVAIDVGSVFYVAWRDRKTETSPQTALTPPPTVTATSAPAATSPSPSPAVSKSRGKRSKDAGLRRRRAEALRILHSRNP